MGGSQLSLPEGHKLISLFSLSFSSSSSSSGGQIEEALAFAQSQMSEAGENNPEVLSELERTLALLAFEKPQNSPFADLLEQSHRIVSGQSHLFVPIVLKISINLQKVASELNEAILEAENQEHTRPKMVSILKLILWAQYELDKKNIKYPKMNNLATARIDPK